MRVHFTKMQGAGNDFVVLDETRGLLGLKRDDYRLLADRHFGVGADQILSVRPSPVADADFEYVIHNADGGEVEQCGNGARCFARYVAEHGLSPKTTLRVLTRAGIIEPRLQPDGRVTVDMGAPVLEPAAVPFNARDLQPITCGNAQQWPLDLPDSARPLPCTVLSMGNPHVVLLVDDVDTAPVQRIGQALQHHPRFPARVNVGFMQVLARNHIRLRVFERGAGETLACGTGACAATVAGILTGRLDFGSPVEVDTRGGTLSCEWSAPHAHVFMTGPAQTVFEGTIDLPDPV